MRSSRPPPTSSRSCCRARPARGSPWPIPAIRKGTSAQGSERSPPPAGRSPLVSKADVTNEAIRPHPEPPMPLNSRYRRNILARRVREQDGRCLYCRRPFTATGLTRPTIEHRKAKMDGGSRSGRQPRRRLPPLQRHRGRQMVRDRRGRRHRHEGRAGLASPVFTETLSIYPTLRPCRRSLHFPLRRRADRGDDPAVQALCALCGAAARRDRLRLAAARRPRRAGRCGCGRWRASSTPTRRGCPTCSPSPARCRRRWSRSASTGCRRSARSASRSRGCWSRSRSASSALVLVFFLVPPVSFWRSSLLYATWFALAGLIARPHRCLRDLLGGERFKRRVMVLGAGARAARIEALARAERRRLRRGRLRRHERRRPRRFARRQPARACGARRGRAGARGAAQRAAAERPAQDQDDRRPGPRFLLLPRARDRPGRSRIPQSLLADLLRRLLGRAARCRASPSGCSTSPPASLLLALTLPLILR